MLMALLTSRYPFWPDAQLDCQLEALDRLDKSCILSSSEYSWYIALACPLVVAPGSESSVFGNGLIKS
jgi:hypothetical protein